MTRPQPIESATPWATFGRQRIALEPALDSRDEDEDRGDRDERELEPGLEERVRINREEHGRADEQEVPPVGRTRGEPGEGHERSGNAGADDRRLPPHRARVGDDAHHRSEVPDPPRDARDPRGEQDPDHDVRDVLARHGEQVVEPGRLEVVPERLAELLVLAENDPADRPHAALP